jgi:hypothetical protein
MIEFRQSTTLMLFGNAYYSYDTRGQYALGKCSISGHPLIGRPNHHMHAQYNIHLRDEMCVPTSQVRRASRSLFTPLYCHLSYGTRHMHAQYNIQKGKGQVNYAKLHTFHAAQRERESGLCVCQRHVIRTSLWPCSISQEKDKTKL